MVYFRVKHLDHATAAMQAALDADPFADLVLFGRRADHPQPVLGELGFAPRFLTKDQIASFVADGVLVVPGVLADDGLAKAKAGMAETLLAQGVDLNNLEATVHGLGALSSTGGAGGVLDVFYPAWKLQATLDNLNYHQQ